MKTIIIYNGKPIYATNDSVIDWFKAITGLITSLRKEGVISASNPILLEEWRRNSAIQGSSIHEWETAYDLKVWRWNVIENDWICKS